MQPGDGGAAILDTISSAVDLLESQPKEYRRVLLLISEERDHGSKHTKEEALIKKIGGSDVLILSVAFSPALAADFARCKEQRLRQRKRAADDQHDFDSMDACPGLQEERYQGSGPDERR